MKELKLVEAKGDVNDELMNIAVSKIMDYKDSLNIPRLHSFFNLSHGKLYFETPKRKIIEFDFDELEDTKVLRSIDRFLAGQSGITLEGQGNIYLVTDGYHTKVGATTYNVAKRLAELQVGNAKTLSIIGSYVVERRMSSEAMLKKLFRDKNVRGEWFNLSSDDICYILNNRVQASNNCEYQVLTFKDAEQVSNLLMLLRNNRNLYTAKIQARLFRKIQASNPEKLYFERQLLKHKSLVMAAA